MKNVEEIYSLSPMQEMMLLHSLYGRDKNVLFNQFRYRIGGELDVPAFLAAWQALVDRHPALRTAFFWEKLKKPVQVVRNQVELPVEIRDWRGRGCNGQNEALDAFLREDCERGFDLTSAPLMRIALIRTSERSFELVWSSHHLIVDRWCLGTTLSEVFDGYGAENGRGTARKACGFGAYINWIQEQDEQEGERFWRSVFQPSFSAPTISKRSASVAATADRDPICASLELSRACSDSLKTFARSHGLTLGVVFQGAWALLINQLTGAQDVLFAVVTSGRPSSLPAVEEIVGSFVNTLPVRARMPRTAALTTWLSGLQATQQRRQKFDYVSLAKIQQWSNLGSGEVFFDSQIVWLAKHAPLAPANLAIEPRPGVVKTASPITLGIAGDERISLQLSLAPGYETLADPSDLLAALAEILEALSETYPDKRLEQLSGFLGTLDFPIAAEAPSSDGPPSDSLQTLPSSEGAIAEWLRDEDGEQFLEDLVVSAWRDVLAVQEIGPDDDFFALGGTSLHAARLHSAVENGAAILIPLLSLFQSTTLCGMTQTLASGEWPRQTSSLIALRKAGDLPPLFLVASPKVNTVGYALLSRHLERCQPVYVLQALPDAIEKRRISPTELPEIAADYLRAIRSVQPTGPYRLMGMCLGSHLALEMALQLEQAGEDVAFLGVIDTWALYTVSRLKHLHRASRRLRRYGKRLAELLRADPNDLQVMLRRMVARRRGAASSATGSAASTNSSVAPREDDRNEWVEDIGWAGQARSFVRLNGEITVFRLHQQPYWRTGDESLGWSRFARRTRVIRLPGKDHRATLRDGPAKALAERLQSVLSEIDPQRPDRKDVERQLERVAV